MAKEDRMAIEAVEQGGYAEMNPSAEQAKLEVMKIHGDAYADLRGSWWVICRPNGDYLSRNWDCLSKLEQKNTEDEAWDEALFHLNPPAPREVPVANCEVITQSEALQECKRILREIAEYGRVLELTGSKVGQRQVNRAIMKLEKDAQALCDKYRLGKCVYCGQLEVINRPPICDGCSKLGDPPFPPSEAPKAPNESKLQAMAVCDTSAAMSSDVPEITMSDVGRLARSYIYQRGINQASETPKGDEPTWVSVKNRLPLVEKLVLLVDRSHENGVRVGFGWLRNLGDNYRGKAARWVFNNHSRFTITHWRPLPAPPNGGTE